MKNHVVITLLLLLSALFVQAQEKTPQAQPDSVIKLIPVGNGSHTSYLYSIAGKLQTPEDVKIRLMAYAPSAAEYNSAKKSLTWTFISIGGLAVSSTLATISYAHNNKNAGATIGLVNRTPTIMYQHHNLTGAYIFTGLATGFLVAAITNFIHAGRHGKKVLQLYNERFE